MFKQRKGITPVIAIVLLLLVTVGAVGVVYTQFQNIANQGNTDANYLDTVDVKFTVMKRNSTGPDPDEMGLVLENTGSDEYNLSEISRLEYQIPGESSIRTGSLPSGMELFGEFEINRTAKSCFNQTTGMQSIGPGDVLSCNTGVEMPSPSGDGITVKLVKTASQSPSEIDSYECAPSTSDSSTC